MDIYLIFDIECIIFLKLQEIMLGHFSNLPNRILELWKPPLLSFLSLFQMKYLRKNMLNFRDLNNFSGRFLDHFYNSYRHSLLFSSTKYGFTCYSEEFFSTYMQINISILELNVWNYSVRSFQNSVPIKNQISSSVFLKRSVSFYYRHKVYWNWV